VSRYQRAVNRYRIERALIKTDSTDYVCMMLYVQPPYSTTIIGEIGANRYFLAIFNRARYLSELAPCACKQKDVVFSIERRQEVAITAY